MRMLDYFGSSRLSDDQVSAYIESVEDCSAQAVERSCKQYRAGRVEGQSTAFAPNAVQLGINARQWDSAIAQVTTDRALVAAQKMTVYAIGTEPPAPLEALGPVKVDFGGGVIDMTNMTLAEKEEVLKNKGRLAEPAERLVG